VANYNTPRVKLRIPSKHLVHRRHLIRKLDLAEVMVRVLRDLSDGSTDLEDFVFFAREASNQIVEAVGRVLLVRQMNRYHQPRQDNRFEFLATLVEKYNPRRCHKRSVPLVSLSA
jgi:hypothetical protein